ncbi:HAMP domain-containing sensor histidine kinase [Nocardioides sp.]|uniref:sensor histidine kinase n=1 Tax=Nocardioides sp. TaxID=35761 RepID=UPI001A1BB961|nr:HAMP domain-containing sensor histidine kinase [Nocardioides sp.]MBJ7356697.1 HAMP domain-containing histidine kinase [Nocardioides sp.]
MLRRPASLTSRLVVTTVALVVLVAVLIGAAATAALNAQLTSQLDEDLRAAAGTGRPVVGAGDEDEDGPGPGLPPGAVGPQRQGGPQTIRALFDGTTASGVIIGGYDEDDALSTEVLDELADVPVDGQVHEVDLTGLGSYRVIAVERAVGTEVTGLPTEQIEDAITSLIGWEALLIGVGALLAAGGGLLLVRRQLRPLREVAATAHAVAALPLAEGDIDLAERVPDHLTDERTEVGQVGSALNALLAHVETSLEARHRSEQQVRQFVADASHELRTPLSTIAGYTELARTRPDAETTATALGKVEEEAGRMTTLVEDLLLLARLDAGRPMRREPVDLTRLLVEAVNDARVLAPEHHWRIVVPDEPIEVTGDEQGLHQVVTNLLTNARKHTPPGTTVTVTGSADGFDVHDDGPGFPPALAPHAFERFARGDASRNRAGGAGLGLALVDAIVRSHAGSVRLTSQPGDTTVAVRLGSAQIV